MDRVSERICSVPASTCTLIVSIRQPAYYYLIAWYCAFERNIVILLLCRYVHVCIQIHLLHMHVHVHLHVHIALCYGDVH